MPSGALRGLRQRREAIGNATSGLAISDQRKAPRVARANRFRDWPALTSLRQFSVMRRMRTGDCERAMRICNLELGQAVGNAVLHLRQAEYDFGPEIAHCLSYGVSHHGYVSQQRGVAQHPVADRAAFDRIAIEQGWLCRAGLGHSEELRSITVAQNDLNL